MSFKLEFLGNEEIDGALLDQVCEMIHKEEDRTAILNLQRLQQMRLAYAIIQKAVRSMKGVKITFKQNEPYKSTGYIALEGENLEFDKPDLFAFAMSLADNTEIYPLVKNKVHMNLTFHNLTKSIE